MNYRFLTDTASHEKLHSILSRLRYNSISRSHQVDSLSQLIAATPHARIVCGDFNDTPLSYTYRLMSRGLQDAFREKGRGFSHTYRGFYNTFRIDYVLVSDDFEVLSYEVPSVEFSDHHPGFRPAQIQFATTMILDSLENRARYYALNPRLEKAFDYLLSTDLGALPAGGTRSTATMSSST